MFFIFLLLRISYHRNGKVSLSLQKHDFSPTYTQNLMGKLRAVKSWASFLAWTARVSSSFELVRFASSR